MSLQNTRDGLYQHSIKIIKDNQSSSGAYIASPNFPIYHYCWFRDGAFTAYAMDLSSEHESAARFHVWAAGVILRHSGLIGRSISKAKQGLPLGNDFLPTRFTLQGEIDLDTPWTNFQLDGFGTWLWALNEHRKINPAAELSQDLLTAADLVAEYLSALWPLPCYDCWEEFPDHVHPHTLAAIYGGLQAHSQMMGKDHKSVVNAIKDKLLADTKMFSHFVKFTNSPAVDASLLGLAIPYNVVDVDDPIMRRTVEYIEETILRDGGLHRYAEDTYYGGGAWILLTAWLGWYYTELENKSPALKDELQQKKQVCKTWIESRKQGGFVLPEQVAENLNTPSLYSSWVERWGNIASPLLWSHAKYIILLHKSGVVGLGQAGIGSHSVPLI